MPPLIPTLTVLFAAMVFAVFAYQKVPRRLVRKVRSTVINNGRIATVVSGLNDRISTVDVHDIATQATSRVNRLTPVVFPGDVIEATLLLPDGDEQTIKFVSVKANEIEAAVGEALAERHQLTEIVTVTFSLKRAVHLTSGCVDVVDIEQSHAVRPRVVADVSSSTSASADARIGAPTVMLADGTLKRLDGPCWVMRPSDERDTSRLPDVLHLEDASVPRNDDIVIDPGRNGRGASIRVDRLNPVVAVKVGNRVLTEGDNHVLRNDDTVTVGRVSFTVFLPGTGNTHADGHNLPTTAPYDQVL